VSNDKLKFVGHKFQIARFLVSTLA